MANRSHSKRLSLFAVLCAALSPAVGCQSNAQQDLVARELRMQEDQIYAMEDYLAQYQQLVCKYRSENAVLRRQLAETDGDRPTRPTIPSDADATPPLPEVPSIEVPPSTDDTEPQPPLDVPEVPPLEETTSAHPRPRRPSKRSGKVSLAAADTAEDHAVDSAIAFESPAAANRVVQAELQGEVVANEAGGGPRLVVIVRPLDEDQGPASFTGRLSLMLMSLDAAGERQAVARWDYEPDEVRAALDSDDDRAFRFHLELPADSPLSDSTELWLRLLPESGSKLLVHTPVNLHEPGHFSSLPPDARRRPIVPRPMAHSSESPRPSRATISPSLVDAGWTTARPGEPVGLPTDATGREGQWRESAEPMPVAVARRDAPRQVEQRSAPPRKKRGTEVVNIAPEPDSTRWSPERSLEPPSRPTRVATAADSPRWSATR